MEGTKMGSIYSDAYFVISTTAAADGDGGCLFKRQPYYMIRGESKDHKPFEIFARRPLEHGVFNWFPNPFEDRTLEDMANMTNGENTANYPLFRRAWCFKERLLGTRILHYTKQEIVFECLEGLNCECGALTDFCGEPLLSSRQLISQTSSQKDGSCDESVGKPFTGEGHNRTVVRQNILSKYDTEDLYFKWRDIIYQHAGKNITFTTDTLPALGGVASKWHQIVGGTYLAGLWSGDILRSLVWKAAFPDRMDKDQEPIYIAPTWSWASLRRPIEWIPRSDYNNVHEFHVNIDLKRTACIPKGISEYGEVTAGWLFITGPVIRSTLEGMGKTEPQAAAAAAGWRETELFDADCVSRCKSLIGEEVLWLLYCTDHIQSSTGRGLNTVMVLARANEEQLARCPEHIRTSPNIYQRIGFHFTYPRYEDYQSAEIMEIYLI